MSDTEEVAAPASPPPAEEPETNGGAEGAAEETADQPEEKEEVVEEECVEVRVKKTSAMEERNDRLNSQNAVIQPLLTGIKLIFTSLHRKEHEKPEKLKT